MALDQSVQSRFDDGEAIDELLTNLIDSCDQIVVVDLPPLVVRKRAVGR